MKKTILLFMMTASTMIFAQIITNKQDIKDQVNTFEVWAFKKPFTQKESYFINYGQEKFKPSNYDLLGQGIYNKENRKFEKGEWLKLVQYLESQNFYKDDEREESIGDVQGRIVTFKKK